MISVLDLHNSCTITNRELEDSASCNLYIIYMFAVKFSRIGEMAFANRPEKEGTRIGFKKPKNSLLPGTSLASVESLSFPLVQEVVLSADIQCAECQKRLAEIMSRMKETESVSVNVLEKKVTLTCRYPGVKLPPKQVAAVYRNPLSKITIFKSIFRSVCS